MRLDGGQGGLTDISDPLQHGCIGRDPNQELKLGICSPKPQGGDENRKNDGAQRVNVPFKFTPSDGRQQAKPIDKKIIAMIFPQDPDLRIYVAQCPAVRKQRQFSGECNSHRNDRRQMK